MSDCLIVGGGVIGLSLAYELAGHGLKVRLIDAGQPGREASWAGAGILPPAGVDSDDQLEQLTALSNSLHAQWSADLLAATGNDNGFRRSGAIYLARDAEEARRLDQFAALAESRGINSERLSAASLVELEAALLPQGTVEAAYHVPDECQIRNPRHLKALLIACGQRGVEISPGVSAEDFETRGDRVSGVRTNRGLLRAEAVCITSGAWSAALMKKLGVAPRIKPIRGQMVLLSTARPMLSRIINEGSRYLVPRADCRLLVGSTEDDVGFDRGTTAAGVAGLLDFALSLVGDLSSATIERTWAGLRPSTSDGLPYLGPLPGLENVYVAAGHFRSGLQLSTGTAVVMSQWIRGEQPQVDLSMFRADRDVSPSETSILAARPAREAPLH
jgi:glycine oxidase